MKALKNIIGNISKGFQAAGTGLCTLKNRFVQWAQGTTTPVAARKSVPTIQVPNRHHTVEIAASTPSDPSKAQPVSIGALNALLEMDEASLTGITELDLSSLEPQHVYILFEQINTKLPNLKHLKLGDFKTRIKPREKLKQALEKLKNVETLSIKSLQGNSLSVDAGENGMKELKKVHIEKVEDKIVQILNKTQINIEIGQLELISKDKVAFFLKDAHPFECITIKNFILPRIGLEEIFFQAKQLVDSKLTITNLRVGFYEKISPKEEVKRLLGEIEKRIHSRYLELPTKAVIVKKQELLEDIPLLAQSSLAELDLSCMDMYASSSRNANGELTGAFLAKYKGSYNDSLTTLKLKNWKLDSDNGDSLKGFPNLETLRFTDSAPSPSYTTAKCVLDLTECTKLKKIVVPVGTNIEEIKKRFIFPNKQPPVEIVIHS